MEEQNHSLRLLSLPPHYLALLFSLQINGTELLFTSTGMFYVGLDAVREQSWVGGTLAQLPGEMLPVQ